MVDIWATQGISSFCYVSHAPFLFMSQKPGTLDKVRKRLLAMGIPPERLEPESTSRNTPSQGVDMTEWNQWIRNANIQFVTDDAGYRTAVILPIDEYEDLMDDLEMGRPARESKAKPRRPIEDLVKELRAAGEIDV